VTLGYTGSRGVHLPYFVSDFDIGLPTSTPQGYVWPVSGRRINTNAGQIVGTLWNAESIYHSLQIQMTRQLTKGAGRDFLHVGKSSIQAHRRSRVIIP
jgi:hypothetical protein